MSAKTKRIVRQVAFGLAGAGAVGILVIGALNPGSVAYTSPEEEDARFRTRLYDASLSEVREAVRQTIGILRTYGRPWRLLEPEEKSDSESAPVTTLRAEVPVLIFTDDFAVMLREAPNGVTLDVHSQSRVGKGDFGENRRHILQFLTELDRRLDSGRLDGEDS